MHEVAWCYAQLAKQESGTSGVQPERILMFEGAHVPQTKGGPRNPRPGTLFTWMCVAPHSVSSPQ